MTYLTFITVVHVAISFLGLGSGFVVMQGWLTGRRYEGWTKLFLAATILTSATGFLFPFEKFLPSHAFAILSLVLLPVAVYARYWRQLTGHWRWLFVVTALAAQYLNVFVLVVQAFLKVPALTSFAPTQTEPPFALAQGIVLGAFLAAGYLSLKKFRPAGLVPATVNN